MYLMKTKEWPGTIEDGRQAAKAANVYFTDEDYGLVWESEHMWRLEEFAVDDYHGPIVAMGYTLDGRFVATTKETNHYIARLKREINKLEGLLSIHKKPTKNE